MDMGRTFDVSDVGGMRIFCGSATGRAGMSWTSELSPGLTACIVLRGDVSCSFETPELLKSPTCVNWHCPTAALIGTQEPIRVHHSLETDADIAGVFVHLSPDEISRVLGDEGERLISDADTQFEAQNPSACSRNMQALAWQMIGCPLTGTARRLYLSGKALELLALSLEERGKPCSSCPLANKVTLSPTDVGRLHAARNVLVAELADPPTLPVLASRVGINVNKLKCGFSQLFGSPVYAFVKARRLDEARLMLESGGRSVSEIARDLGYQSSSFATAFRQRFGVSPSDVAAGKFRSKKL